MWAAWHVPLVLVGFFDWTTFQSKLWWWLSSIVFIALVGIWVYNTRQRVLAMTAVTSSGTTPRVA